MEVAFLRRDEQASGPAAGGEGKFSFGGGWKPRDWKNLLKQKAILPALAGEEPCEEILQDFPGWAESQAIAADKFFFNHWLQEISPTSRVEEFVEPPA